MGAECKAAFNPFQLPNLKARNVYIPVFEEKQIRENKQLQSLFRRIFGNLDQKYYSNYHTLLESFRKKTIQTFEDSKFIFPNKLRLSKLYDYQKKKIALFKEESVRGNKIFEQQDVQLSYLSTVLSYLAESKQILLQKVLLTREIVQDLHIFAFRMFCNGQEHTVVIDDYLPIQGSDKLTYSHIIGKEIWPVLLEKAWCKQIGGYKIAKGLSPEECFEEITGVPAYSYEMAKENIEQIHQIIQEFSKKHYFLCCIARENLNIVQNSQSFLVETIQGEYVYLYSNYIHNKVPNINGQNNKGTLSMTMNQFIQSFQYLVVGFYRQGYVTTSFRVRSQKRQQKLYQMFVNKKEEVSIRFTQFYEGYLDDQSKSNYAYSPLITFELYDSNFKLLNFCQGCDRMQAGAHSSYITERIFHEVEEGKYFIKLEVDWEFEHILNEGNLVFYASKGNVNVEQVPDYNLKSMIKTLNLESLTLPNTVIIQGEEDTYKIVYLDKKSQVLISIKNNLDQLLKLQLSFAYSKNLRVKNAKLLNQSRIEVTIPKQEIKIIEIVPERPREEFKVEVFVVKRLYLTQQ